MGRILSAKAIEIKKILLSEHAIKAFLTEFDIKGFTEYKASKSWAGKFARDAGWRSQVLHGEAGAVNVEALNPEIQKLWDLIKEYNIDNVYSMDETGLFYKVLPNHSYVKVENACATRGTNL